jgi:LEA14-like dessication related protein
MQKFYVVLFSIVVLFTFGCRQPKSLEYLDFQNLRVDAIGLKGSVISAELKYFNPNRFKMQLKSAEMDISVNKKFLGRSVLDTLMHIPAKDTFLIPVQLKVDGTQILSHALSSLFTREIEIKLDGKAKIGKAGVFFNFPFSYEGKQKINLFE